MVLCLLSASLLASLSFAALGWVPRSESFLLGLALLGSIGTFALARARPLLWFLAMALASGCWGMLLAPVPSSEPEAPPRGGLARIHFEVHRSGCGEEGCWAEARLVRCTELEAQSCVRDGTLLGIGSDTELALGAEVTALARLKLRSVFRNPRATTAWPDTRPEVYASLQRGSPPRIDEISALDRWVARSRSTIRAALLTTLRPPHSGIARALLLGEGAAVERELNDAIRNAGVSHVLAVSGMHVTLLVGVIVALVRVTWLWTPLAATWEARRVAAAVGVLLAPLIARLCGASPSAVRAAWTSTLMYLVIALGLRPCALSVSALVVATYAVVSPRDALHPGFVLSVLATAALLTHRRGPTGVGGALLESARAWLATAPFLLLCFGQTSLIALLANVALLPLGTALVPLAALQLSTALLGLADTLPLTALFELADAAFVETARFCSALDPGLSIPPLTVVQALALPVAAACFMLKLAPRTRLVGAGLATLCIGTSECALRHELAPGQARVTFVDVGQGDAILLEAGEGHAALIDAGGSIGGEADPGARAVVPLLRARRIEKLDLLVLSHPHPDHYGGFAAVLDAFPVRELWDTGQAEVEDEQGAATRLLERFRASGGRVRRPHALCGHPVSLGSTRLEVLAPCPAIDELRGANDNSFVVRLVHGERSFLFTGDIEQEAEASLVAAGVALQSDVLKVAHHGSRTSSTPDLLRAVSPWLAVVSAGRANRFGHPHPEVAARLAATAPYVLRTDQVGGIQVLSNGHTLSVSSFRGPEAPPWSGP